MIQKFLDWLFPRVANTYYAVMPHKQKLQILKWGDSWLLKRNGMNLLSPTPKFLGFGLKSFEAKFERFFKIRQGETALDVGACIGDTTVPMLMKVGVKGFVIAVEPHPINIKCLSRNVSNFSNVEIVEKAVWNSCGSIKFNVHYTPTGHSIKEDKERSSCTQVECDTLDNIVGDMEIDFAKVDVQGAEIEVLEGAQQMLAKTKRIVVETHGLGENALYPKVSKFLRERGFNVCVASDRVVHAKR